MAPTHSRKSNAKNVRAVTLSKFHRPNDARDASTSKQNSDVVNKRLRSFLDRVRDLDIGLHRVTVLVKKYDGNTGRYDPCIALQQADTDVRALRVQPSFLSAVDVDLDSHIDSLAGGSDELHKKEFEAAAHDEVTTTPLSQLLVGMNTSFYHVPCLAEPDPYAFTAEEFFCGSSSSRDVSGFYVPVRRDCADMFTASAVCEWLRKHLTDGLYSIAKHQVQPTYIVTFTVEQLRTQIRRGKITKLQGRCYSSTENGTAYVLSVGNLWVPIQNASPADELTTEQLFQAFLHESLFKTFMPR
jgi:hypothetical protein